MAGNRSRPPGLDGLSKWILEGIVQKQPASSTMKETIEQMISDNLAQTAERYRTFFEDLLAANKTEEEMKLYNSHMEDYLIQGFRQRHLELLESKDVPPPDEAHLHALRTHSDTLQEYLRLDGTVLLDRLIERDVMSDDGRESILARKTNQQKNAAFIRYVSQTFSAATFNKDFLPLLKVEYEDLARKLSNAAASPTLSKTLLNLCHSCKIREQIRIRKFATCLYQIGAITAASHLDLTSTDMSHEDKWNHLKRKTRKNPSVLMKALKSYNASLYDQLSSKRRLLLECTCQDEMNSTIGQCSDTADSDIARMSDFSDSSSHMQMETVDEMYAGTAGRPWGEDTFISRFGTSSLSGSDNEPEGPRAPKRITKAPLSPVNDEDRFPSGSGTSSLSGSDNGPEGPHSTQQRIMKAPLSPVNKENPFAMLRRHENHIVRLIRREQSQPTRTRFSSELWRRGLTRPVSIFEADCNEVDNYFCTERKRKRIVSDAGAKDEDVKTFSVNEQDTGTAVRPWKENPFAMLRRHENHIVRLIRRETSQSTRGLTRPVSIFEADCNEVDNYFCTERKRKRIVSDLGPKDKEVKTCCRWCQNEDETHQASTTKSDQEKAKSDHLGTHPNHHNYWTVVTNQTLPNPGKLNQY